MSTTTISPSEPANSNNPRPSRGTTARLLFRFATGLAQLAGERFVFVLRSVPTPDVPAASGAGLAARPVDLVGAAIGALATGPAAVAALKRAVGRRVGRASRLTHRYARRLAQGIPGTRRAFRRAGLWRSDAARHLARLAQVGREEQEMGRILATAVLDRVVENGMAMLAQSSDVKRVIQEQSQGMAASAIARLRDRSVGADEAAENLAARVLGRPHHGR